MKNPATCDENATLKNGQQVRIRAIRPTDKGLVLEMFRSLESESIDTRFFHAKKVWTDDNLRSITEVDFETVVAFAVSIEPEGDEVMIGGGAIPASKPPAAMRKWHLRWRRTIRGRDPDWMPPAECVQYNAAAGKN